MYVIVDGYAYMVDGSTGKKISFDVYGQMQINSSDTISITNQKKYSYDEMFAKMNFAKSIEDLRKSTINSNTELLFFSEFYDRVKDNSLDKKKFDKIVLDTVTDIENYNDDVVITFDKNGGTGTMAQVRKEVGDKYKLPACTFTAPANKRFKDWKIGETEYDVGDEITLSVSITVKAIWENIPQYTVSFDGNGGEGTMESVTKYEGEEYTLPESTFTAPEGKEFSKWLIGETEYEVGDKITVTANTTVKATYVDETPEEQGTE